MQDQGTCPGRRQNGLYFMIGERIMVFIGKTLHIDIKHIPDYGKFIVRPTHRTIYTDVDGRPYAAPADTVYNRDFRWEQNHYTIILPGLNEWAERYWQAMDPATRKINSDFDWRDWHRDGLLFTREIYRRLPHQIPVYYAKLEGDESGLVEDFEVSEEKIDSLLEQLGGAQSQREPVIEDVVVVGVKDEDGYLCLRLKTKGKPDSFTFCLEYDSIEALKEFMERLIKCEVRPVSWESSHAENAMYFYPQTIGGLRHMGQLHIYTDGKNKPDFTAYINVRYFIRSIYRTIIANVTELEGESVYKKLHSNAIEWFIDDDKYDQFMTLTKNKVLAKWVSPTVMKVKDYLDGAFDSIFDEEEI